MNKALALPLLLSASLIACNAPSNEEAAAQAVTAVGSSVSALTTNAALADGAASAQSAENDNPKAPEGIDGMSCVTTTLTSAGLRVDFGTGCTVNGHDYSGAYTIRVSLFGGLSVSLDFDSFVVDGRSQQGDMSVGVGRGFVSAHADLAIDDGATLKEITLDGELRVENQNIDFNGTGRYADDAIDVSLAANGLHTVVGACYADAGSVTVEAVGYPTAIVTFDANTPSTGLVSVTVGTFTVQQALPPTPNCPAG